MAAYTRITFRDRTFDPITKQAVEHAESFLPGDTQLHIFQGPYSTTTSASAKTHAGSGAVDVDKGPYSWREVEKAFRMAGWAAWYRPPSDSWGAHVHAILLGDKMVHPQAAAQRQDYYHGLDGLYYHRPDSPDAWRPRVIVPFNYPLPYVDLSNVRAQALSDHPTPHSGVKVIQRTLNLKTGTTLVVDGVYGPKTKAALKRWERQHGGDGDGVPGPLIKLLGAARFRVRA